MVVVVGSSARLTRSQKWQAGRGVAHLLGTVRGASGVNSACPPSSAHTSNKPLKQTRHPVRIALRIGEGGSCDMGRGWNVYRGTGETNLHESVAKFCGVIIAASAADEVAKGPSVSSSRLVRTVSGCWCCCFQGCGMTHSACSRSLKSKSLRSRNWEW